MKKHGKKYLEAKKLIENKVYTMDEAVSLLKKTSVTKFDGSCEIHMKLGLDPTQADQNLRTTVVLPEGTGNEVTVVAFVGEEKVKEAMAAGALMAGTSDLIQKIEGGWTDFDVAVATPDQMKELAKVAKILGQKRLMPNPKSGTVSPDVTKMISDIKKGKVELRVDKEANLHNIFGKASFDEAKLKNNLKAILKAVLDSKPASVKGTYVETMTIAGTMGPGIPLDVNPALAESR
ncbi:50S ribosomal protein L1 [Candidatus Gracilibacteria bacterium]|nr:50S ribosomal protein L1 [Candidatus Gracilibacteria bacterium]